MQGRRRCSSSPIGDNRSITIPSGGGLRVQRGNSDCIRDQSPRAANAEKRSDALPNSIGGRTGPDSLPVSRPRSVFIPLCEPMNGGRMSQGVQGRPPSIGTSAPERATGTSLQHPNVGCCIDRLNPPCLFAAKRHGRAGCPHVTNLASPFLALLSDLPERPISV
jgi:hypothetical protein